MAEEVKSGMKTSELVMLVAGIIVAIVPVVMDKIEAGSTLYVILGVLVAVATYITGRTWLKGQSLKAAAMTSAAEAVKSDPPKPLA